MSHTVTLKADDDFFNLLGNLSEELHTSKRELIRRAVMEYRKQLECQKLKEQVQKASLYVRENSQEIIDEFDALSGEEGIMLKPNKQAKAKVHLENLLESIPDNYQPESEVWGDAQGSETW